MFIHRRLVVKIFSVVVAFQWSKGNFCLLEIEKNQDIIRYDDINYLYLHYVLGLKRLLVAMRSYAKLTSNLQCKQNFRRPLSFMSKISF